MAAWFVIRDAVHGDIRLTREEGRLLDTPQVQRLRGVQQLGLAHLVYPGARHSRFEHSIGTLAMVQRLVDAVNRQAELARGECRAVTAAETRLLRAAALLHDVTHIPFGHNIEDQSGILPRHDRPERFLAMLAAEGELGAELEAQGLRQRVLRVLGALPGDEPPFLAQLISDTICSDLMDYLERDALYTGLRTHYDPRVADYFRIEPATDRLYVDCEKSGLLREAVLSEILQMLQARYYFSERVYYHHAKVAAGAMVERCVDTALRRRWIGPESLYAQTDSGLLLFLRGVLAAIDDDEARAGLLLLEGLEQRRLLKRVAVFPYAENAAAQDELVARLFDPARAGERRDLERSLERSVRERFGTDEQVLFYCPNRRMQLKEVDTLVRFPGERELRPLSWFRDRLPRIADLEASYLRLWRAYAFTTARDRAVRRFLQERVRAALPEAVDAYRV